MKNIYLELTFKDGLSFAKEFLQSIDAVISVNETQTPGQYKVVLDVDKMSKDGLLDVLYDAGLSLSCREDATMEDNSNI